MFCKLLSVKDSTIHNFQHSRMFSFPVRSEFPTSVANTPSQGQSSIQQRPVAMTHDKLKITQTLDRFLHFPPTEAAGSSFTRPIIDPSISLCWGTGLFTAARKHSRHPSLSSDDGTDFFYQFKWVNVMRRGAGLNGRGTIGHEQVPGTAEHFSLNWEMFSTRNGWKFAQNQLKHRTTDSTPLQFGFSLLLNAICQR